MNEQEKVIPQGAIWVKNFKLIQSVSNFITTRNTECPKCHTHFQSELGEGEQQELNETIVNHVMTVKIKAVREKYIAIFNPRKSLSTHPDYFLYVYQAYTGAPSIYPFANTTAQSENRATFTSERQNQVKSSPHISTRDTKSETIGSTATSSTFHTAS